jgi:hypothetical protein
VLVGSLYVSEVILFLFNDQIQEVCLDVMFCIALNMSVEGCILLKVFNTFFMV